MNEPKSIFLDVNAQEDFNEQREATWSSDNATGKGVQYIRRDLTEDMAKEFGAYVYLNKIEDELIIDHVRYFSDLFTEFLTSREA